MNGEQQANLNDIWERILNREFDNAEPVRPSIVQNDEHGQEMLLPLDTPPGGNIRVRRLTEDDEWFVVTLPGAP